MLNELEALSRNISRLIVIAESYRQTVARLKAENAAAYAELTRLRVERDALLSKTDQAQARLNEILDKLPRPAAHDSDRQFDPLAAARPDPKASSTSGQPGE